MIEIREATFRDVPGITEVHKSDVKRWYSVRGDDLIGSRYNRLSIDERWLHGGTWMSEETCYSHVKSFTDSGGKILVAVLDDKIIGEIEFIYDYEPPPYLDHIEIYVLMVHRDYRDKGVGRRLMGAMERYCLEFKASQILLSSEERSIGFYRRIGYELFEHYGTISIDLNKLPKIRELHYEPLRKINRDLVNDKLLLIGRFHNTNATLYNIRESYPLRRITIRHHFFRIFDGDMEHILVIRKSNMINNSMYCWLDRDVNHPNSVFRTLLKCLHIARKLNIQNILVALRDDVIKLVRRNKLNYKFIERIPWFRKKVI